MMLNTKKWKEFRLVGDNYFTIEKNNTISTTQSKPGNRLYDVVGAKYKNNGNVIFIDEEYQNLLVKGNCICLIKTGQGSVGKAVYKFNNFIPSNNICVLRSKIPLSKYIGNFLVTAINNQSGKYSYGYIRNENRIVKETILLPINEINEPDWGFMEQYMIKLEERKKADYITYLDKILNDIQYKKIRKLNGGEWKDLYLTDICDIESGQDIYEAEREIGNVPYITSTSSNNGIKYFVSNTNPTLESNAISVNRNGSVGYCFYHKYSALYSNDCRKLILKFHRNEYVSLFITNQIAKQKDKYSYGYKMGTNRLKKQKIMLPINDKEEPDFKYMVFLPTKIIQKLPDLHVHE